MARSLLTFLASRAALVCAAYILTSLPARGTTILDFEGLGDLEEVARFYPGVTFTNAIAQIAGFSLNDAEFPPASGVTVALPDNGEITIEFDSIITSFQGLFTHSAPLTLEFFLSGNLVGISRSIFVNNLAISGDAGSAPNEAISFGSPGFDAVRFTGGGFYTVDDISFEASVQEIPELDSISLTAVGLIFTLYGSYRRRGSRGTPK